MGSDFEDIYKKIQSKYGDSSIRYGDEAPSSKKLPTGSILLDYILDGGIPVGRFSRFYGGFSSTKSVHAWNVIAEAQKQGMSCAYYNIEKQYSKDWCEKLGVDTSKLIVLDGTTIEETSNKLESLLGEIDVHVVDSCSSAVSIDELNSDITDWPRGLNARVWNKCLRRAKERFDADRNVVILIDQVRASMGYGGGVIAPGGKFLEHLNSLTLLFKKSKWLYYDSKGNLSQDTTASKNISGQAEADGILIKVMVEKSHVSRPYRAATLYYDLHKGKFDRLSELITVSLDTQVVGKKSAYFKYGGESYHGLSNFRNAISSNSDLYDSLTNDVSEIIY